MKSLIVAFDKNQAIGLNGDLPWGRGLKDDLARFKKLTTNSSIIMGRKNFQSIGAKPLPNRENIVLSRTATGVNGVLTAGSLQSAYALARYPIFVIGGGQVYAEAIDGVDILYVTEVDVEFSDATVFFPIIDTSIWQEVDRQHQPADQRNRYSCDFVEYRKIAK